MVPTISSSNNPRVVIENIAIEYNGRTVNAKKLTVSSNIPISIEAAWENIQTPKLLQFVSKGMIKFNSAEGVFPKKWEIGQTYGAKMRIFGFIPFGGIHYLFIEKIDGESYEIATKEWDNSAKVWNHNVKMKDIGNGIISYEDSIVIYGGFITGLITVFAKVFYKHRQKRWYIVAKENLNF